MKENGKEKQKRAKPTKDEQEIGKKRKIMWKLGENVKKNEKTRRGKIAKGN